MFPRLTLSSFAGLIASLLVACQPANQPEDDSTALDSSADSLCEMQAVPLADIQGTGFESPMLGARVIARGVVTLSTGDGLYFQEARPIPGTGASHGLYVSSRDAAERFSRGTLITVSGTVAELGDRTDTLTALVGIEAVKDCGVGPEPPVFDARLPLGPAERESYEAMQLFLEQAVTVTEARDVAGGEIIVSALGLLRAPTEVGMPGEEANALARKNFDWSMPVRNEALRGLDPYTKVHAGAVINFLSGVLGHDGRALRLHVEGELGVVPKPAPAIRAATPEAIRIAGFNLYEYFNGDGRGGGFPGERGAQTEREFLRQSERIVAAVQAIRPDVLAVQELENDGFDRDSAVHALSRSVSEALGVEYAVATPESERVGPDAISVGMIYRADRLETLAPAQLLEGGTFGTRNRVPLGQAFADRVTGARFVVVSNHLKSKGFCPESGPNTDQGDGQACWNAVRVEGAVETAQWAQGLASEFGTSNVLMVGDFNAYRREDPVRAIVELGFEELVGRHHPGMPLYSYIFRGAAGTLDYAFATPSLASLSEHAVIWNINAAYPWSGRPSEPWLRSSDHDPVVVDLVFSQPATAD